MYHHLHLKRLPRYPSGQLLLHNPRRILVVFNCIHNFCVRVCTYTERVLLSAILVPHGLWAYLRWPHGPVGVVPPFDKDHLHPKGPSDP